MLHLHHAPKGEEYVFIELASLLDARVEQAFLIEKMEPLRVAQGHSAAQGLTGRAPAFSMAMVLLMGESGTCKELIARAMHEASPRANSARGGLVEAASGGALFLNEVGDIPLAMQVKLLRLLETGTYRRVGSTEQRYADIRVVSATQRDLDRMAAQGLFREDLYYRLSTFPIHLPALPCAGGVTTSRCWRPPCWPAWHPLKN